MMLRLFLGLALSITLNAQNLFMGEVNDESTIRLLKDNSSSIQKANEVNNLSKAEDIIKSIYKNLVDKKLYIEQLEVGILQIQTKKEQELLQSLLEKEQESYRQMEASLTQLSVGSVDVKDLLKSTEREKVDFDKSIDDIFEPFAIMLMRFTQTPREIENINLEIQSISTQIKKLNIAIQNLKSYKNISSDLKYKLNILSEEYGDKRLFLIRKQNSLNAQLLKLEKSKDEPIDELIEKISVFLSTHGLTFVYAVFVFFATFGALYLLKNTLGDFVKPTNGSSTIFAYRLLNMLLSIFSVILSVSLALVVIYWRADWLMLAFVLFFLLIGLWSFKNTIPRYIDEMFLILNIGIVREKEYVVLKGVPYIVENIGFFATLFNDKLSNAKVRISLNELVKLSSRCLDEKEEMFPTSVGDFIFIEDNYGHINFQSPSIVEMKTFGQAIKTYSTPNFLSLKPINISKDGFTIIVGIALDYKHQQVITSSIVKMLEKGIIRAIEIEEFSSSLTKLWVEFSEAKMESLNLKILAKFDGRVAGDYYYLERTIRRASLEVCNKNGWRMPHPQLDIKNITPQ